MLAAVNVNTLGKPVTPHSVRKAAAQTPLALVVLNHDGSEARRVTLDAAKAITIGSSTDSSIVIGKVGTPSLNGSVEVAKDGRTAIFKAAPSSANKKETSSFLKAGDEFSYGGKTFRVEMDENAGVAQNKSTGKDVKIAKKPAVTFQVSSPAGAASTPSRPLGKNIAPRNIRHATPHVSKLGLNRSVMEIEVDDENSRVASTPMEAKPSAPKSFTDVKVSTSKPERKGVWSEVIKQAERTERLLEKDRQMRLPLLDISTVSKIYAPRDTIPMSVRKFMAARAKKPAAKSVRPSPEHSVLVATKEPSPLRVEIQKEGLRLMGRRAELVKRLEDYELDSAAYEQWTVAELEQRVWGLEEEERRAAAEAILIESGHDPRDFQEFSSDEIEDWLEREVVRKTTELRIKYKNNYVTFQGTVSSFTSPARSEQPSFAVFRDEFQGASEQTAEEHVDLNEENVMPSPIMAPCAVPVAEKSTMDKIALPPPTIKVTIPKSDPFQMTCEQIRTELKERGLKVSGLKSVIAERLAQAFALEVEEEEFLTEGHQFLGKSVVREFESGTSNGKVVAYLPAVEGDEDSARFYIVHEDKDTEVLDFDETKEAIERGMAQ